MFGHNGPWMEMDKPEPLNVYGVSKLAGEMMTALGNPEWVVVRTASLFGGQPSGKKGNFVQTMLRLAEEKDTISVVNDLVMSPTYVKDLASILRMLMQRDLRGLFHLVNQGQASWFSFADAIFRMAGVRVNLQPCSSADRDKAVRPRNSALVGVRADTQGLNLRPWREALEDYLKFLGVM